MRRSPPNVLCRVWGRNRPAILAAIAIAAALAPAHAFDMKEISPAPPTLGTDLPASHIGPQPSSVQPELLGEHQTLTSGKIDFDRGTITLPLYQGAMKSGQTVWYVVLDTDDKGIAEALGINYAAKLTFADIGRAARKATLDGKSRLVFEAGTVDFSPKRSATPGDAPNFFPPKQFHPGSIGDKNYSLLVKISNAGGHIYNTPILAYDISAEKLNQFCNGAPDYNLVHDKIARICPRDGTVTLR